ncbi:MAG: sigma-70 family RNA polymerase sigma factor [Deltaproteobacteria bacterium]|nr:sigma-70 family RNA polymerase sigma factor [Deltaproteobacteria bacterium]
MQPSVEDVGTLELDTADTDRTSGSAVEAVEEQEQILEGPTDEEQQTLQDKAAIRAWEHDLVGRVKNGDQRAFRELVERYGRQVRNHCLRMVGNEDESEDLTQEVFFKVFRSIEKYEHAYSFYTWLYRITVNCCIDHLRRRKRKPANVSLSHGYGEEGWEAGKDRDLPDGRFVPDNSLSQQQTQDILSSAISQLSHKLRVILVLKEIEGFSYDEIAEIIHVSRGTVKSRLFRARERMKEILTPMMAP